MVEEHTCSLCQRGDGRGGNGKGGERMGDKGRPRQAGDGEGNAGHGRGVERRAVEGRFSKLSTVLARYHTLHDVLKLCFHPTPKSYMSLLLGGTRDKY